MVNFATIALPREKGPNVADSLSATHTSIGPKSAGWTVEYTTLHFEKVNLTNASRYSVQTLPRIDVKTGSTLAPKPYPSGR